MRPGRALLALLLAAAPAGLPADTSDDHWPPPHSVVVTPSELAFERRDHEVNSSESLFFVTRFNDGWVLMANYFEFRNPLFKKWGIYVVVTDPQGRGRFFKHDIRDQDMRTEPALLEVTDGTNSVQSGPGWCRITLDFSGFRCDLRIENILPAWKAGEGKQTFGRAGRASTTRTMAAPWALVTGTVAMDDEVLPVRGQGMLEKNTIVLPLNRQEPLLHSLRLFSPEETPQPERWYVEMLDITSHEAYGPSRSSRLVVARGQDWVFTTPVYTLDLLGSRDVAGSPYPAPRSVRVSARHDGYVLEAVYRTGSVFNVTDVIEEVPRWLRSLVTLLIRRPVYMRFLGELEGTLQYPDGHVEALHLYGPYEYVMTR